MFTDTFATGELFGSMTISKSPWLTFTTKETPTVNPHNFKDDEIKYRAADKRRRHITYKKSKI